LGPTSIQPEEEQRGQQANMGNSVVGGKAGWLQENVSKSVNRRDGQHFNWATARIGASVKKGPQSKRTRADIRRYQETCQMFTEWKRYVRRFLSEGFDRGNPWKNHPERDPQVNQK